MFLADRLSPANTANDWPVPARAFAWHFGLLVYDTTQTLVYDTTHWTVSSILPQSKQLSAAAATGRAAL